MTETVPTYTTNGHAPAETDLLEALGMTPADLLERLDALENALDTPEWRRLTSEAAQEFTRTGVRNLTELARVMRLKNPLIKRGVEVKKLYVWGQGWTVKAQNEDVQAALDAFLYDAKNDDVLGSHEARMALEIDLETDGNLFFCFFVNQATGRVRVRMIKFDEIDSVIHDPDDAKAPWFYKRVWTEQRTDFATGATQTTSRTAYYPDWRYTPVARPSTIGTYPIYWDRPVYHVKVGGYSNWTFGLCEFYDAIDWAAAYKSFLEDWASIVRSLRRFAWQVTASGGNRGVAAARAKLNSTLTTSTGETNPPPLTGSAFIGGPNDKIAPINTNGATIAAEDGRRLLLMVAASFGLSETFFGDADIGSLATAKSLDRPTELMMLDRQTLWRDVFLNIFNFVLLWAVKAPQGGLRALASATTTIEDGQHEETLVWRNEDDADVAIEFPPLLQHDIPAMVTATVNAATLGKAGMLAGTIDLPTLARILLTTLGVQDADEIVERLFPGGEAPADAPALNPADTTAAANDPATPGEGQPNEQT